MNSSFRNPSVLMKFAVDEAHERNKHVSKLRCCWTTCSTCNQKAVSAFCHFKPVAFLHPIYGRCLPKWRVRRQNVFWQLRRSWCDNCSDSVSPRGKILWCSPSFVEELYPTPHIHEQMTAYIMATTTSTLSQTR